MIIQYIFMKLEMSMCSQKEESFLLLSFKEAELGNNKYSNIHLFIQTSVFLIFQKKKLDVFGERIIKEKVEKL